MTNEQIRVIDKFAVQIGETTHPVTFKDPFVPTPEYKIHDYEFLDTTRQRANGCIFEIKPRGSTRVMRITDKELTCLRIAVKGKGWLLRVSPEGVFDCVELDAEVEENPVIELKQGWVDCCIAGDGGVEVADISSPPFDPKMEEEVPIDDPSLPQEFWDKFYELKSVTTKD